MCARRAGRGQESGERQPRHLQRVPRRFCGWSGEHCRACSSFLAYCTVHVLVAGCIAERCLSMQRCFYCKVHEVFAGCLLNWPGMWLRWCARCPACITSMTCASTLGCGSRATPRPARSARRPCLRAEARCRLLISTGAFAAAAALLHGHARCSSCCAVEGDRKRVVAPPTAPFRRLFCRPRK